MEVHLSLIYSSITYTNSATTAVLAIMILLLSGFQPYKGRLHNQLDILFLTCIVVFMSSAYYLQFTSTLLKEKTERHIVILLAPLPIVYPLCLVLYHTWKTSRRLQSATKWIRALLQGLILTGNWMCHTKCSFREAFFLAYFSSNNWEREKYGLIYCYSVFVYSLM